MPYTHKVGISKFSTGTNMKKLLIITTLLTGCTNRDIIYFKDSRTNVCFARIVHGRTTIGYTYVPCDSVVKFLVK